MNQRKATISRNTLETQITVSINLDGTGQSSFETGVPFLDHMMDQIARHGLIDLAVNAKGDLITLSEATVKVTVGGHQAMTVAEGNGPVNALDAALRKK